MENTIIRQANVDDCEELSRMSLSLNQTFGDKTQPDTKFIRDMLDSSLILVAELEGKLVGFAAGTEVKLLHMGRSNFDLHSLYVEPKYRRKNIAGKILNSVVENLQNKDIFKITVKVWNTNEDGVSFYNTLESFSEDLNATNYSTFTHYFS